VSKKFILCVDENWDDANLFGIWLTQQGYEVKATTTYIEALQILQHSKIDLSILDARLQDAEGDGFELCKTILTASPTTKIILNSGDTCLEMKNKAKNAGAKAFFGKPVDFDEMDCVIQELIG
jgi:DNA-binding NtrC family response regulator